MADGRWPANLILTAPILDGGWEGVVGGGEQTSGARVNRAGVELAPNWQAIDGQTHKRSHDSAYEHDTGTYSRFFLLPPDPDPYDEYIRVMSCEPGCRVELR
jgi:hypothetical protein